MLEIHRFAGRIPVGSFQLAYLPRSGFSVGFLQALLVLARWTDAHQTEHVSRAERQADRIRKRARTTTHAHVTPDTYVIARFGPRKKGENTSRTGTKTAVTWVADSQGELALVSVGTEDDVGNGRRWI